MLPVRRDQACGRVRLAPPAHRTEFDHLRDKAFNIGAALSRRNWQAILDEMTKCEVVCANCHRRRTALRRGALRTVSVRERSPD